MSMEVGCGGHGLRTANDKVVNMYFWHLEPEGRQVVRREDYLGRADLPETRRKLLRRMADYERKVEEDLSRHRAKLERSLRRKGMRAAGDLRVPEIRVEPLPRAPTRPVTVRP